MIQHAKDRAARHAELALESHNGGWHRGYALDVLSYYVDGIEGYMLGRLDHGLLIEQNARLAWALALTEKRTDLKPHEQKLLDAAWDEVVARADYEKWEEMGR